MPTKAVAALLAGLVAWTGATAPAAENHRSGGQTAGEALAVLERQGALGRGASVLQLVGVGGRDQPPVWRVVVRDPAGQGSVRDLAVQNGQVVGHQVVPPAYQPRLPKEALPRQRPTTDSGQAFVIADREARRQRVGFDSLDYELVASAGLAYWVVRLVDRAGRQVGELLIRDGDGYVVRERWFVSEGQGPAQDATNPAPPAARAGPPPNPAAGSTQDQSQLSSALNEGWEATRDGLDRGADAVRTGAVRAGTAVRDFFSQLFQGDPQAAQPPPAWTAATTAPPPAANPYPGAGRPAAAPAPPEPSPSQNPGQSQPFATYGAPPSGQFYH